MIEKTAGLLTRIYVQNHMIKEEDAEVYAYGFELLVAAVVNALVLTVVALITGYVWQTVLYALAFVLLRTTAGGFHASTHLRCLLLLLCTSVISILIMMYLPGVYVLPAILGLAVLAGVLVFVFAPVEDHNNPFTPERRVRLRRLSLVTFGGLMLLLGVLMAVWMEGALALVCGIFSVAGSLPAGHLNFVHKEAQEHEA